MYGCGVPRFGAHRALASYIVTTKTTNTQTNKNAWRNKRVGGYLVSSAASSIEARTPLCDPGLQCAVAFFLSSPLVTV